MNTHKYLKPYAIVPVTMDAIRDLVELGKQQADRIAELEDKLSFYEIKDLDSGLKPKPLSDEEIKELIVNKTTDYELCRAIEERHGIK